MGKNPHASSSSFKQKLNDQDYMELVCENGHIFAKTRRSNNNGSLQNQRTQSILDLQNPGDSQVVPVSESQQLQQDQEIDEQINNNKKKIKTSKIGNYKCFESSTLNDDSLKGLKNVEVIATPPDEQSAAVGRSTELYFAQSSSMFSRGTSRDQSCCSLKRRKYGDIDAEESTYLSNYSDDESDDAKTRVHARTRKTMAKRKRTTEVHKLSERKRRNEISKRMRALQDLLPNCYKDDKVSLLDEAIKYMRTLQYQVQMMGMRNGIIQPSMMLPMGHYSPMGRLGMHMGTTAAPTTPVPQFLLPMNVQGTSFPGTNINASSQMLSAFLNQPTGLVPNSPIFSPLESCTQQFVVPSCFPETQATSFTQFPKSVSTSDLEDAMQFRGSNG